LTCISNKIGSINIGSIGTYTHSTKFKPIDVINLTNISNQTSVRTSMVPIENNPGSVTNIKSSYLSNIPEWKP
jgi:hypothetical protein